MTSPIFVFGSNLAGRHGRGAAQWAMKHRGAVYGIGLGRMGDAYAIPTKDEQLRVLPLARIKIYVDAFLGYARSNPDLTFELTPIGCGLAGYAPADIAPLFAGAPPNVQLPAAFREAISA
jgi:hypothetical protein